MSKHTDGINLPNITLPDGNKVEAGFYPVTLSDIAAVYNVTAEGIAIQDAGDVSGLSDNDIISEAPEHYDIKHGEFTGDITLEDGRVIPFKDNKPVNCSFG